MLVPAFFVFSTEIVLHFTNGSDKIKRAKQTQHHIVTSLRSLGKSAGSNPHACDGMMGLFGDSGAVRFSVRSARCALFISEIWNRRRNHVPKTEDDNR